MPQKPVSVAIQPDPFKGRMDSVSSYIPTYEDDKELSPNSQNAKAVAAKGAGFDLDQVRFIPRPLLGIQVKPNTPAFAQVVKSDGTIMSLLNYENAQTITTDASGKKEVAGSSNTAPPPKQTKAWTQWFLQSVKEERVEKTQLVETFGEPYFYAFGEKPRSLMFTGVLMNTVDYNWRSIFWQNWENNFRATKLIQNDARMYITFDDILVEGYPVSAMANQVADTPNLMVFSFNFFVTNYTNLSTTASGNIRANSRVPTFSRVRSPEELSASLPNEAFNRTVLRLARGMGGGLIDAGFNKLSTGGVFSRLGGLAVREAGYLARDLLLRGRAQSLEQLQNRAAYAAAELAGNTSAVLLRELAGESQTDFNAWFGEIAWLSEVVVENWVQARTALPYEEPVPIKIPSSIDSAAQLIRGETYRAVAAKPHAIV